MKTLTVDYQRMLVDSLGNVKTKLNLIEYNAEDFSLGSILSRDHGTLESDELFISSAMSLYFQWPEYRRAHFSLVTSTGTHTSSCTFSCDQDERDPTQIFLEFDNDMPKNLFSVGLKLVLRFEIFLTDYAWEAEILDVADEFIVGSPKLVISIPTSLKVSRLRRLPRISVHKAEGVTLKSTDSGCEFSETNLVEIGADSLVVKFTGKFPAEETRLIINEKHFRASVLRVSGENIVLQLKFKSENEVCSFFDIYCRYAYPELKSIFKSNFDEVLDVYTSSGFFAKFSDISKIENSKLQMKQTWTSLVEFEHELIAQKVVSDSSGKPVGLSGLIRGFYKDNLDVWTFTQMCVIKNPVDFDLTVSLYRWRLDYLISKKENFYICVWFDGETKWNERTWLKFRRIAKSIVADFQADIRKVNLESFPVVNKETELRKISYKDLSRTTFDGGNSFSAHGIDGLNPQGLFNHFISLDNKSMSDCIKEYSSTYGAREFMVTQKAGIPDSEKGAFAKSANNYFLMFHKKDLPLLYSCFEHSLAVLKEKNRRKRAS